MTRSLFMRLASVFCLCLLPLMAHAQSGAVQRCIGPAGQTIFTDKPCAAVGASQQQAPRVPPSGAGTLRGGQRVLRPGCAATMDDVLHEVTMAFDTQDPNRLVGVYHWPGLDSQTGYKVAGRLQVLTRLPLVDAQFTGGSDGEADWHEGPQGELVPIYRKARAPSGIRVLTARGKQTQVTQFRLRRNANCWWISY